MVKNNSTPQDGKAMPAISKSAQTPKNQLHITASSSSSSIRDGLNSDPTEALLEEFDAMEDLFGFKFDEIPLTEESNYDLDDFIEEQNKVDQQTVNYEMGRIYARAAEIKEILKTCIGKLNSNQPVEFDKVIYACRLIQHVQVKLQQIKNDPGLSFRLKIEDSENTKSLLRIYTQLVLNILRRFTVEQKNELMNLCKANLIQQKNNIERHRLSHQYHDLFRMQGLTPQKIDKDRLHLENIYKQLKYNTSILHKANIQIIKSIASLGFKMRSLKEFTDIHKQIETIFDDIHYAIETHENEVLKIIISSELENSHGNFIDTNTQVDVSPVYPISALDTDNQLAPKPTLTSSSSSSSSSSYNSVRTDSFASSFDSFSSLENRENTNNSNTSKRTAEHQDLGRDPKRQEVEQPGTFILPGYVTNQTLGQGGIVPSAPVPLSKITNNGQKAVLYPTPRNKLGG